MERSVKPCLKVTGLHIEGLKALQRVDWPADGMGWAGQVPDLVMVGGINGSGKTTLQRALVQVVMAMRQRDDAPSYFFSPGATANAWVDLHMNSSTTGEHTRRIVVGDADFLEQNMTDTCLWAARSEPGIWHASDGWRELGTLLSDGAAYELSDFPRLIYIPTDRHLAIPPTPRKSPGRGASRAEFYHESYPPKTWDESLEALLYDARWADLNAKEAGHPERATHFASYAGAFQAFFGDQKSLVWSEQGELVAKIHATGAVHSLEELSSGEQQVIVLAAELYRQWRPGSLVLIDEPELHFHPTWQTRLWLMLEKLQQERGGQVIVTTQSTHLFGVARPGATVLLGKRLG
jgi:hypothetical protein